MVLGSLAYMNLPGVFTAKRTAMLLYPMASVSSDSRIYRGFTMAQKKINNTSRRNNTGKPSPNSETAHQSVAFTYGMRQTSKKTKAMRLFKKIKKRLAYSLYVPAIAAIYKSSLLARFSTSFSSSERE
jgi:hypothetical protein